MLASPASLFAPYQSTRVFSVYTIPRLFCMCMILYAHSSEYLSMISRMLQGLRGTSVDLPTNRQYWTAGGEPNERGQLAVPPRIGSSYSIEGISPAASERCSRLQFAAACFLRRKYVSQSVPES